MKTVCFITLGCKVNQYETQVLREAFLGNGFAEAPCRADVCIVNTCSVTRNADEKSRDAIRRSRTQHPHARLVVTGCLAEYDQQQIKGLGVDDIIPQSRKYELPSLFFESPKSAAGNAYDLRITGFRNTRAFVKIQDGCSKACTFCKVRRIRSKAMSRPAQEIMDELKILDEKGFKEIVLCGINLALYGEGRNYSYDLADLIREIAAEKFSFRIRLSSIDPASFRKSFFSLFERRLVCPFVHLSFQSGDNETLKAMNKNATVEGYERIVERLRAIDYTIAVAGDIIVGFPAESDFAFGNTLSFIRRIKPMRMHIFRYSEPTLSITTSKKVPARIVDERYGELKRLAEEYAHEYSKCFRGKVLNVLIEGKRNGFFLGYSENYLRVLIPDKERVTPKEIIPVTIIKTEPCGRIYGTLETRGKNEE